MITSVFKEWRFDHSKFQELLATHPKLTSCLVQGDIKFETEDEVRAAFKCAGHLYLSNRKDIAVKFLRAILSSSDVPDILVCSAALFDAQIAVEQSNLKYADTVCKRLVECPQWIAHTEELRNLLALIGTRIKIKADPNCTFPTMTGKMLEDIEWLNLRLHYSFRDGTFVKEARQLFALRKIAKPEIRVAVDITLGELFYLGYENLDIAEDFFFSALQLCSAAQLKMVEFYRPIHKIYYELGSVLMCNNKFYSAFYALLIGLPEAAMMPDAWMRIAQTAILCVNSKNSGSSGYFKNCFCRETPEEVEEIRQAFDEFYSHEANRKHANDIVDEEMFRNASEATDMPAPTYNFAFVCVQKACKILEGGPTKFSHLHVDLILLYVFLSLEQNNLKPAFNGLQNVSRLPNVSMGQRNVVATYFAKYYAMQNDPARAVAALNSIVYLPQDNAKDSFKDGKRQNASKSKGYLQNFEASNFDSCYASAFGFVPIDSMRHKFIYSVQKSRNDAREFLQAKQCTSDLKHPFDVFPFGII